MDILTSNLPDEQFYIIQKKLYKWLQARGFVTWKQIQKTCRDLLAAYTENYIAQYGNFPEYRLFMPLLRNGSCEMAVNNGKTGFTYISHENQKDSRFEPLLLLNNFPKISSIVSTYEIESSLELKVWCDLEDRYTYKNCNSRITKIGIYKSEDKVYSPAFIYDGKNNRQIPNYDENIDALNIARCFVRCSNERKLFIYHQKHRSLNVIYYSELPILITRALVLFEPSQLDSQDFLYPLTNKIEYKNVDDKVVNELSRIFEKSSVEVLDD